METALLQLVNEFLEEVDVYLDTYQKIDLFVNDINIVKELIKACKFKDIGNVYDYPDVLPQPQALYISQSSTDYDALERIAVSEKFNSVMKYTTDGYYTSCIILVDTEKLKKFLKKATPIINRDTGINIFRDVDFTCGKGEYIEITNPSNPKNKMIDTIRHTVSNENLVFDPNSVINEVMGDINAFFTEKTLELYNKLEIPYKRGVILYGDPGNGKSAMIREIIRTTANISKIIISPSVMNITFVLASLMKALKGKQAIVVIEDIDSVINNQNRSEFLNVLDGVDITSGVFFIGTTNYPDRIDPAFMNRSGRFDRTYKIDNPSESTRRMYFKSRKLSKLLSYYKVFKDDSKPDTDDGIIDLFVKNSEGMPMANLKELITSTCYTLALNQDMSIEEALTTTYDNIVTTRQEHVQSYNLNLANNRLDNSPRMVEIGNSGYSDDEDDEE